MKFRKDGRIFDNIEDARAYYCKPFDTCDGCAIYFKSCKGKCEREPRESARLMGFEIIEDEPPTRDMTLAQAKEYCKHLMGEEPPCDKVCELKKSGICGSGGLPCDWKLDRARLTPEELEICKALNAKYVTRDSAYEGEVVNIWIDKPFADTKGDYGYIDGSLLPIAAISKSIFKSVNRGDCICIGGEGG